MARAPRTYRAPIVVTLAAALIPACGSGSSDDNGSGGTDSGGTASGGKIGTGGRSSGGSGGSGGSTGGRASGGQATGGLGGQPSGGIGGDIGAPDCPDTYSFPWIDCVPDARCEMSTDCTSGEARTFYFNCAESGDRWVFEAPGDCENPYEFCDGIGNTLCVDETWMYQGQGGNPPGPCPEELPAEGASCYAGDGFGAARDACGYPCGDAWTVTGCVASSAEEPIGPGEWTSDGACSAGGAGGD